MLHVSHAAVRRLITAFLRLCFNYLIFHKTGQRSYRSYSLRATGGQNVTLCFILKGHFPSFLSSDGVRCVSVIPVISFRTDLSDRTEFMFSLI